MSKQFIPFNKPIELTDVEMVSRSNKFHDFMKTRRTIRDFSRKEVPLEVIDNCLRTAGTAPSGANQQPWHFVVVRDASLKTQIRIAAEEEEKQFYAGRAGDTWLETLEHLGTDAHKPFLEEAPVLIAIFEQKYAVNEQGDKIKHYYAKESVGIATGMLITALHNVGLVTLTHTPSPMNFLTKILKRPAGERPFLLLVVGHPAKDVQVPHLDKKDLPDMSSNF
ncbi:MAG: nitroreductase family protein [Candidatus Marinimicrobia bacterium]|jgi:iodotyrosine deiodinase|nr:nitroreductase family protein [Candidatus Neomarinimicrobiota bacterium]MBT3630378.1 nitroreductase family protein [Candidatus Neomarinimicrobiota bacterium]MBT3823698.1 nitroreductase family protein [Candidatus Neomarinimicrobiota bacterium]MBT4131954.1 nitroreductase family protein [Candidatus Neomarinimicrobiota bacterium]MBT4294679.1 nitroreductase family protein [Candidatus Neomarinimicrobiota bacterium]